MEGAHAGVRKQSFEGDKRRDPCAAAAGSSSVVRRTSVSAWPVACELQVLLLNESARLLSAHCWASSSGCESLVSIGSMQASAVYAEGTRRRIGPTAAVHCPMGKPRQSCVTRGSFGLLRRRLATKEEIFHA